MAQDEVGVYGGSFRITRVPASGELMVGDGYGFTLTTSNITFGNPVTITVPLTVNGQIWSTATGFKFPDNTTQTTAATTYTPSTVATGTIQSNISGSTAAPSANTISSVLDNLFGTTQGTVIYRGASSWSALAPGTTGQYLQTQGASANPQWATVPQTWTSCFRTTDNSITSNTTVTSDSQLTFPMLANTKYSIKVRLFVNPGLGGIKIGSTGPSGLTRFIQSGFYNTGVATTTILTANYTASYPLALGFANTGNNPWFFDITIFIANGPTAGTYALQFAQNSSSTTATVIYAGSFLEYAIAQ